MSSLYNFVYKSYIYAKIECAAYDRSAVLKLDNWDLVELPRIISECQELRKLNVQCNKLTTIPAEIKYIVNLEVLTLDFNCISKLPVELWSLHNLTELNLSHNPLKKLSPAVKNLKNLEILWLNSCQLKELPEEICELELLDILGARNNFLTHLPANISKLNIRWLTLTHNKLSSLPDNFKLENLIHLNLSHNNFKKIPQEISHLPNLKFCLLKGNKIQQLSENELRHLSHVFRIDIQRNPLVHIDEFLEYNLVLPQLDDNQEGDSDTSEDWEESLNSSEMDLSSSNSDSEGEHIARVIPYTSKFLLS